MSDFQPYNVQIEAFKDGQVYSSPSILSVWSACKSVCKVKFCASIEAHINGVQFCGSIAGFKQCVGIGGNGCFDFEAGVGRLSVCISDFSYSNGNVCFYFKIKACVGVKIPFDGTIQKCYTLWQTHICVPLFSAEAFEAYRASEENQLQFLQELSSLHE